jgi:transposase InsO family protein
MLVGASLDRLATDLVGPLPVTSRGNRYILTITDYFTKLIEICAVPDQTAVTCAQIMLNDVVCRFGCPLAIHSDQGRNFESEIFQELCKILEIRNTRTSPSVRPCRHIPNNLNKCPNVSVRYISKF